MLLIKSFTDNSKSAKLLEKIFRFTFFGEYQLRFVVPTLENLKCLENLNHFHKTYQRYIDSHR